MESNIREEINIEIQQRQRLVITKISSIATLLGLGAIKFNSENTSGVNFINVLYLVPFISTCFDLLIMGKSFSIRRKGAFLRLYSKEQLEKEYENFVGYHRDNFFKYGSIAITFSTFVVSFVLINISSTGKFKLSYFDVIWFGINLLLFIFLVRKGNKKINSFDNI